MSIVSMVLGALLIGLTITDLAQTAVSVGHGAGPISGQLSNLIWRSFRFVHRRVGAPWLLVLGGPAILVAITLTWVVLLILGWALVFGAPETLLTVQDGKPVPALGRIRYAAGIVIGRGSATFQPSGALYEVLEPFAALTGLTVLSLGIAYVLPVVQGVVAKRTLALYLSTLGRTPADVLERSWNGTDFGSLDLHLIALVPRVAEVAQSHLAYPVIHFFHSRQRATSLGPSMVALDEALTAHTMVDDDAAMPRTATDPLREAINHFLETLSLAFIRPADLDVGPGDDRMAGTLERLREAGVPVPSDAGHELTEDEVRRNRLLRGYLLHDGWTDTDVMDLTTSTEDTGDRSEEAPDEAEHDDGDEGADEPLR